MDNANYLFGMQQWNSLSLSITCEISGNVHRSLVWLRKTNEVKVLLHLRTGLSAEQSELKRSMNKTLHLVCPSLTQNYK